MTENDIKSAIIEIDDIYSAHSTQLIFGKNTPSLERNLLRSCNSLVLAKEALELQSPQEVVNKNGTPLSGNCPRCNAQLTKPSSPVGCKWCLQKLKWRDEE